MSNIGGGAQAHANKPAPIKKSSDVDDLREGISDLGSSVGDMANRQYQRAQDVATMRLMIRAMPFNETRSPLSALGWAWASY
jgi:hypothetical protein